MTELQVFAVLVLLCGGPVISIVIAIVGHFLAKKGFLDQT